MSVDKINIQYKPQTFIQGLLWIANLIHLKSGPEKLIWPRKTRICLYLI